ncbi:hydantoin racemase [Rhodococcus sp. Eu-32]|uniref:hydantoin racemase n=1 Tax=Rhodococcus sp. Eu-32 TaxID=1017319 RepID=UPI000DF11394|nr:hydantoin racemase [Rhodococcus sp. Eu-32]RRQ28618.1 hydantoin racemase [Rhodococcus sp. Eu-32]
MHLLAFTPIDVDAAELRRRQERYDHLAPTSVTVELRNIGSVAPSALNTEADIRASEDVLTEAFRAVDPTGFDGFLPDCVLDPCAEQAEDFAVPLYGLSRLTASFYASQGQRLGALARNAAIAAELDRRLAFYRLDADPTQVLGLDVHDIADTAAWGDAVIEHARGLTCSVAINACSAVELVDPPRQPLVVDPTATALRLLGLSSELESVA